MDANSKPIPPPPVYPPEDTDVKDVASRIIQHLAPTSNAIKNTEAALTQFAMLREEFELYKKTWVDSIDSRKLQLDRIEEDLDGYSDKIEALTKLVQEQIDLWNDAEKRMNMIVRDLYGFGEGDETRVLGYIGKFQRLESIVESLARKIAFREGMVQLLTPLFKSTVLKAILIALLSGGGIAAVIEVIKGIRP